MESAREVMETLQQPTGDAAGLLTAALLLPTVILVYLYWKSSDYRRLIVMAGKLPGPRGYPIIGNALELTGSHNMVFETMVNHGMNNDDILKMWAGNRLLIFLWNPADIELILRSESHLDKSVEYDYLRPWLGNGLLLSTGDTWRTHRKIIAPSFHLNVLRSFMPTFNENAKTAVSRMAEEKDREFDVHDYMSECTVETLIETVMGVKKEMEGRSCYDYAMAVMKLCDIVHLRQMRPYLQPDFLFNATKYSSSQKSLLAIIHGLTEKILRTKKSQIKQWTSEEDILITGPKKVELTSDKPTDINDGFSFGQASGLKDDLDVDDVGEKKRSAFLETIIDKAAQEDGINDKEVKEQLDTIMFEPEDGTYVLKPVAKLKAYNRRTISGHDTTAAASSFFLCMMAAYPQIQDKCHEELKKIFGDSEREVTFQDTQEMKYIERCLMETLRLYPPVPIIARRLKSDVKLASRDLTIPADCTVIITTYMLHRRADIYPEPEKFDPDHFLPEKSASRHYYSFIPFSAGPRSCVGRKYAMLKLKTILATVLRNYRVLPGLKEEHWKLQADIILKRSDGFNIRLQRRN